MEIDWSKQPTPEHVALEYEKVIYWCVLDKATSLLVSDEGYFFTKGYVIHEKPKSESYMPEVGEWCEVETFKGGWKKARLEYKGKRLMVLEVGGFEDVFNIHVNLRPFKSERDKFIEKALAQDCEPQEGMLSRTDFVGKMFDVGFKAPEGEG